MVSSLISQSCFEEAGNTLIVETDWKSLSVDTNNLIVIMRLSYMHTVGSNHDSYIDMLHLMDEHPTGSNHNSYSDIMHLADEHPMGSNHDSDQ